MTPAHTLRAADRELDTAERLLTVACAAKRYGVSVQTIRRMIKRGILKAERFGPLGWYRVKIKPEQTQQT